MKKIIYGVIACVNLILMIGCGGTVEYDDPEDIRSHFEEQFGFKMPSSVSNIKCKISNVTDNEIWLTFDYDDVLFSKIIAQDSVSMESDSSEYICLKNLILSESSAFNNSTKIKKDTLPYDWLKENHKSQASTNETKDKEDTLRHHQNKSKRKLIKHSTRLKKKWPVWLSNNYKVIKCDSIKLSESEVTGEIYNVHRPQWFLLPDEISTSTIYYKGNSKFGKGDYPYCGYDANGKTFLYVDKDKSKIMYYALDGLPSWR